MQGVLVEIAKNGYIVPIFWHLMLILGAQCERNLIQYILNGAQMRRCCFIENDIFTDGDFDTYWYGSYNNGYGLYTPGSVMTLYYDGFHNYPGFQLVFYPADPGEADLYTQSTATIGESES